MARIAAFVLLVAAAGVFGLLGALNLGNLLDDYQDTPDAVYAVVALLFFVLAAALGWAAILLIDPRRRR